MARSIAKITRPAVKGVAPRARLFRHLDAAGRAHAVTWVSAPAGSGKTTLAASWLAARRRPCLWYQIDAGDADPASFFYYLRAAVAGVAPRRGGALPLLTPEYAPGLSAYARHFLERVGASVRSGTVLVLDDWQDLPEDAPLQRLLPAALAALPPAVRVLVLSRAVPPPPWARLITDGAVAFVDGDELSLTPAETAAVARARTRAPMTPAAARTLQAQTGGWMAGTVLLLDATRRPLPAQRGAESAAEQVLFDYFATELFERASPQVQRLLVATAPLREVTIPAAQTLAGEPRAAELLAELVARNGFTVRLAGQEPRYRYHPLFREFLLARGRRTLDPEAWRSLAARAASLVATAGAPDEAAAILTRAGAPEHLADLVRTTAPLLARQGRLASVEAWLRAVPSETIETDPWLTYWLAACRTALGGLVEARQRFEAAYRAFRARDDVTGALLAWAGFVNTFFYVWDDFTPLDPWIAEMEDLRTRSPVYPSVDVEVQVTHAMFASLMWRAPAHPNFEHWENRAIALLDSAAAPELRMQLAAYPVFRRVTWGENEPARRLIERMRPVAAEPGVRPLTEIFWCVLEASYEARVARANAAFAAVERGLAVARRTGVLGLNHLLALQGVYAALAAGDLATARRYHETAGNHLGPGERLNRAHYLHLAAWIELCAGDVARAEELARASLALAPASGADLGNAWGEYTLAHVLVERGAPEEAAARVDGVLEWARRVRNLFVEHDCLLTLAHVRSAQGREADAVEWLRRALRLGRERGYLTHTWMGWRKEVLARLAALALRHGVEVEHVRRLVRESGLAPPADAPTELWPFPIRLRALGRFELSRDGEAVSFGGARKPVELLQAVVALGGEEVQERTLVDSLWPDGDGDAGQHALETTLYRLRKLLGSPGAVVQRGRTIGLDPRSAATDVGALRRALREALHAGGDAGPEAIRRGAARVVELYRGPLLPANDAPWARRARERLRADVARLLRTAGRRLQEAGQHAAAEALAARALEADPELPLR